MGVGCIVLDRFRVSHVAVAAQLLEGVLALLVLGAPGAFGRARAAQFLHDLPHRARGGLDGKGAGGAPDAAKAFTAAVVKIQRDHRDVLTLDIFPDVQFRPVQQGMDPDVGPGFKIRFELVDIEEP